MDPTSDHRETRHRMGFATEWTFWKGPGVLHHIHQADASEEDIVSLCGGRLAQHIALRLGCKKPKRMGMALCKCNMSVVVDRFRILSDSCAISAGASVTLSH